VDATTREFVFKSKEVNWKSTTSKSIKQPASSVYIKTTSISGELQGLDGQLGGKYFDYFVFNIIDYIIVDSATPRSGARHRTLA
jgi:hypothetical protein